MKYMSGCEKKKKAEQSALQRVSKCPNQTKLPFFCTSRSVETSVGSPESHVVAVEPNYASLTVDCLEEYNTACHGEWEGEMKSKDEGKK